MAEYNWAFKEIEEEGQDYIIVPRALLSLLLDGAEGSKVRRAFDLWRAGDDASLRDLVPEDPIVHIKVRRFRKQARISQAALAERANIHQPDLCQFERGGPDGFEDRKGRIVTALRELIAERRSVGGS